MCVSESENESVCVCVHECVSGQKTKVFWKDLRQKIVETGEIWGRNFPENQDSRKMRLNHFKNEVSCCLIINNVNNIAFFKTLQLFGHLSFSSGKASFEILIFLKIEIKK